MGAGAMLKIPRRHFKDLVNVSPHIAAPCCRIVYKRLVYGWSPFSGFGGDSGCAVAGRFHV